MFQHPVHNLNTRELVIDKISSIVQSNNSNTQAEVVPCTQGQEIQVLSKFPPTPTGSTSTKSTCSISISNPFFKREELVE